MPARGGADGARAGVPLPGGSNNATNTMSPGRQALGANWQSALCVTSVYDAMAQLQQENESLREELHVAKQTRCIVEAKAAEAQQARAPERVEVCDKHEQEIRLLRKEKLQLEKLGEQQRAALEARAREAETACQLQMTKYQEKHALDPNAAKRVALSVQTLRDALDKVVEEKEELAIRYSQLNRLYGDLQSDHVKTVAALEATIARLKAQRGVQRVVTVLSRWSTSNVERAWRIWTTRTSVDRVKKQERTVALHTTIQLQGQVSRLVAFRLGEMASRSSLARTREVFELWRGCLSVKRRHRQSISCMTVSRYQRSVKRVFESWGAVAERESSYRAGMETLSTVLNRHKTRNALKKWVRRTQVEFPQINSILEKTAMRHEIAALADALHSTRQELDAARTELQLLLSNRSDERQQVDEMLKQKLEMERAIKDKVGRFLRKQSDRQLLLAIVARWRGAAVLLRSLKKREQFVRLKITRRRLLSSVAQWRSSIDDDRKFTAVLHRLRNVKAVQCFNSWKQATAEASARKRALRQALFTMQQQLTTKCFAQWRDFHDRRREVKRQLQWLAAWTTRKLLSQAISRWKTHFRAVLGRLSELELEQSRARLEADFSQHKQQLVVLIKTFYLWRQYLKTQSDRTKLLSKYAARLKSSIQLRAMRSWIGFYTSRKQARELVRKWIYRSYTGHLSIALAKWRQATLAETQSATLERLIQQHEARVEGIEQQLTSVQMMREELLQRFAAEQTQHQDYFQGVLTTLQASKRHRRRLLRAVDAFCSRHTRLVTLRTAIKSWYQAASDVKAKRHTVQAFRAKAAAVSLQVVFSAWRQLWIRRKRIVTTVDTLKCLYATHSLSVVLDCWIEFQCHQKRVKQFARLCLSRTNTCYLSDVLQAWRRVSRTNHLLRTAVSNALYRSATGRMAIAFSKWQAVTLDIATSEKEARRRQAMDDLRALISVKWSLSVVRTVFGSWKAVVAKRKALDKAAEQLQSWYHVWLQLQCLSAWRISLDKQAALDAWLRRWMAKTVGRKLQRALGKWKSAVLRSQMEDVQALRAVYELECDATRRFKEEVHELKEASGEMEAWLVEMETAHTDAVQALELSSWQVAASRCFGAWKLRTLDARRLLQVESAFTRICQRKRAAFYMDQWRGFVLDCRSLRQEAQERGIQVQKRAIFAYFQSWRVVTQANIALKRMDKRVRSRRDKKRKLKAMASWRSFVSQSQAVTAGVDQLDQVMRAVELRVRFSQWLETLRLMAQLEQREEEKRLRLEQLTERVRERLLSLIMTTWHQLVKARQTRQQTVDLRFTAKCLEIKLSVVDMWRSHLQLLSRLRLKLGVVDRICRRAVFQLVWRSWTRFVHKTTVGSLIQETRQLKLEHTQATQQLQMTASDLDKAMVELVDARSALTETESRLADASSQWTHKEERRLKAAARTTALQTIVLRWFAARSVVRSFRLWREQCCAVTARHTAVRLFALVIHRQRSLHALSVWKADCKTRRRRVRFQNASRLRALRRHLQLWKRVVTRRAAAKLFLARRLLVCISGPQSLSWGFRLWRMTTAARRAIDIAGGLGQDIQRKSEQTIATRRRLFLAKWLWTAYVQRLGQMRAFVVRCQTKVASAARHDHNRAIRQLQDVHANDRAALEARAAQELVKAAQRAQEEACSCEAVVAGPSLRAIKAVLHRVSQATTVHELFASVSGTFGQFLHGCSAILFLLDPTSNELWTQREHDRIIQVPVSIGITGCTLTSGAMVDVESMLDDPRYHPMVDQLVLGELRAAEGQLGVAGASGARTNGLTGGAVGLLSAPLLSNDGAVYGVLQVAVPTSATSPQQGRTTKLHAQLFARTCGAIIEQLLTELLRNCRDRVRSRSPDRFAKLFKQSKNWRKYFSALERKCVSIQDQLRSVSEERHALVDRANHTQTELSAMHLKLKTCQSTEREFAKEVTQWKKKLLKLKTQLDAKETQVMDKTRELQTVVDEFQRYKRHQRTKELDAALTRSPGGRGGDERREERSRGGEFTGGGQLAMLRADLTAVKNQLVRAEADNLLLVRAIEMARQNDGQLPAGMVHEVARITLRVTKDT